MTSNRLVVPESPVQGQLMRCWWGANHLVHGAGKRLRDGCESTLFSSPETQAPSQVGLMLRLGKREMRPEGFPWLFRDKSQPLKGGVEDSGRTRGVQSLDGFPRQVQEMNWLQDGKGGDSVGWEVCILVLETWEGMLYLLMAGQSSGWSRPACLVTGTREGASLQLVASCPVLLRTLPPWAG